MNPILKKLGGLLAIGLLAIGARATVVLQDNFDSYSLGDLAAGSGGKWLVHSGTTALNVVADSSVSAPNAIRVAGANSDDENATLTGAPYSKTGSDTLYFKFSMRVSSGNLPTGSGAYFAHLKDTASNFRARVWVYATGAAGGYYKIGIANNAGTQVPWGTDLAPDTTYIVVVRYVLASGVATLWINPSKESDTSVTGTDTVGTLDISAMAFRQAAAAQGAANVDDLVVGTAFSDLISGPPVLLAQPQDLSVSAGANVSFSTTAFGGQPLAYQWYSVTNGVTNALVNSLTVAGATTNILILSNLTVSAAGNYYCMITNSAGTNFTRSAVLTVAAANQSPIIDTQPAGLTRIVGENVSLTVTAHGVPDPAYQWMVITNGVTNSVSGANVAGATATNLVITGVTANQAGLYFVTITNVAGRTNSAQAALVVNLPPAISIADFRAKVDGSYAPTNTATSYTLTGIVTTTTNMTSSSTATEFYMQDGTGGIAVFWNGAAPSTSLPPQGAQVRVTAPMAAFNGLIEIAPVSGNPAHSVTILSSNNVVTAQPLPMDPNLTFAQMKTEMESRYFVASNVTLAAGATFGSSVSEFMTNNSTHPGLTAGYPAISFTNHAGDTFTIFFSSFGGIAGLAKPSGPVTIYGILTFSSLNTGSQGFEFVPLDYAHFVSYVSSTNIVTNARKGDAQTNSYTESVLRPGETQTTYVYIGDPDGGGVTLTPVTAGLPASASWTVLGSGAVGVAKFTFTPASADSGSNYLVSVSASTTSGAQFTNTQTVYVPTADEQKMAITEFLANPTTNASLPNFNPLKRPTDTDGVSTNDQYIEVANVSGTDLSAGWTLDYGNRSKLLFDSYSVGAGVSVPASSSVVVYSGGSEAPALATPVYASTLAGGLGLRTSSSSWIILRNASGNIIDRVAYSGADQSTNGSLTRFPTINSAFVPQPWVSTNVATPGAQYDGAPWSQASQIPAGIGSIQTTKSGTNVVFSFTAIANQAATLWNAASVTGPFSVTCGRSFPTTAGAFTNVMNGSQQFYYLTTQTNYH
jgi:hypothetical protein